MNIIGTPIGGMDVASSRIRFYRILDSIVPKISWEIYSEKSSLPDLCYIQKAAYAKTLSIVKEYIKNKIPVVYDIDDAFGVWEGMFERSMLNIVDVITTDTEERRKDIIKYTDKPVYVVPDALDYVSTEEEPIKINDKIKNIVTFGSNGGVSYSVEYLSKVPTEYTVNYISSIENGDIKGNFIKWELHNFLNNLKMNDIAVLAHPDTSNGSMKSNNRLLVCMSIGMPCIVLKTHAYSETMRLLGYDLLVANTPSDVPKIIEELKDPSIRKAISEVFIKYSWENYNPKLSGELLYDIFFKLINKI